MDQAILEKLNQMEGNLVGKINEVGNRVGQVEARMGSFEGRVKGVEENVSWLRDREKAISAELGKIDPSLKKSGFWKKAGIEALRGGVTVLTFLGVRWIFTPSKKAKELAPTTEAGVPLPSTGRRTEMARA